MLIDRLQAELTAARANATPMTGKEWMLGMVNYCLATPARQSGFVSQVKRDPELAEAADRLRDFLKGVYYTPGSQSGDPGM